MATITASYRSLASALAGCLLLQLAAGCKGESITDRDPDAVFGTVRVHLETNGVNLDTDGYVLDIRGKERHNVSAAGATEFRILAGPARFSLEGVSSNCHIAGEPVRTVTVSSVNPVDLTYVVTCGTGSQHIAYSSLRTDGRHIMVLTQGSSNATQITNGNSSDTDPVWSASGNRIAYATLLPDSVTRLIAIVSATGDPIGTIGSTGKNSGYPSWAPSDDRLLFSSNASGNSELYVMEESGAITQLTHTPEHELRPSWSPDGTMIVFDSDVTDGVVRDLFIMNSDGTGVRRLATEGKYNFHPSWSPDGKWIAFTSQRGSSEDVYIVHPDGSGLRQLTSGGGADASPAWSADGRSLIFESARNGMRALFRIILATNETTALVSDGFDNVDPSVSR